MTAARKKAPKRPKAKKPAPKKKSVAKLTLDAGWKWLGGWEENGTKRKPWRAQSESFNEQRNRRQGALFMDVGLGKTAVLLNLWQYHRQRGHIKKGLYVTLHDLCDTVEEEMQQCLGTKATWCNMIRADSREKREATLKQAVKDNVNYLVLNYEALVGFEQEIYDWLGTDDFAMAADESTHIKKWNSDRSKACCNIGRHAKYRHVLTGTPVPEGPQDIHGQYLFADSTIFGASITNFRQEYCVTNQYNTVLGLKRQMHTEYWKNFHSIASVKKSEDYSDIPEWTHQRVYYELSKSEKRAYERMKEDWIYHHEKGKISATTGMIRSLRLAQICSGFAGAIDEVDMEKVNVRFKNPSKIKVLKQELLRTDGKFIIWCAWKENVRIVMELLARMRIKTVDYYGETENPRKHELLFRKDPSVLGFVGTPQKGGLGLNLQGPKMKKIMFYSNTYQTLHRTQGIGRGVRGAITHKGVIVDFCGRNTVEPNIVRGHEGNVNFQTVLMRNPKAFLGVAA